MKNSISVVPVSQCLYDSSIGKDGESQAGGQLHFSSEPKQTGTFNLLDHAESLELVEEYRNENRYICPVCGDNHLTIGTVGEKRGAYRCHSTGCSSENIREAVAPWDERKKGSLKGRRAPKKPVRKPKPVHFPSEIRLARLPVPVADVPQVRLADTKHKGEDWETDYIYSDFQGVVRIEKRDTSKTAGWSKKVYPWYVNESGERKYGKGPNPWSPYRFEEAVNAAIESGANAIFSNEGEKCVEIARESVGLATITLQGADWDEENLERVAQAVKERNLVLVYLADNDKPGRKKAEKIKEVCSFTGTPCIDIDPLSIHPDLKPGDDIEQILELMGPKEFIKKLEAEIHSSLERKREAAQAVVAEVVQGYGNNKRRAPLAELYNQISAAIGHRLRFNELKKDVEFDKKVVETKDIRLFLVMSQKRFENRQSLSISVSYWAIPKS